MASVAAASRPFTRRTFLRGATVSLALPWLESLPLRAAETGELVKAAGPAKPPVRLAWIFFPNGTNPREWEPTVEGADWDIKPSLEPLAAARFIAS